MNKLSQAKAEIKEFMAKGQDGWQPFVTTNLRYLYGRAPASAKRSS